MMRSAIAIAGVAFCVLVIGLGIRTAVAADPRLDLADAALEKAQALLEASQSGATDPKVQKRFDKAVARAIADVEAARAEIVIAKDAVDNP